MIKKNTFNCLVFIIHIYFLKVCPRVFHSLRKVEPLAGFHHVCITYISVSIMRWTRRDIFIYINSFTKKHQNKVHTENQTRVIVTLKRESSSCPKTDEGDKTQSSIFNQAVYSGEGVIPAWLPLDSSLDSGLVFSAGSFTLFDQFSCVKLPTWNLTLVFIKSYRYICMKMSRLVHRNLWVMGIHGDLIWLYWFFINPDWDLYLIYGKAEGDMNPHKSQTGFMKKINTIKLNPLKSP